MAQYTAGELDDINYVAEVTYGTIPTSALAWAGRPLRIDPTVDMKRVFHIAPGSRSYGYASSGPWDCGFDTTCHCTSTVDWRTFWGAYAYGSTSGLATTLGSFTAQTSVTSGGTTYYHYWPGSKIDKLTIKAPGPGMPYEFDASIKSAWVIPDTNKVITDYQSVTVGASATATVTSALYWFNDPMIDAADFRPANWSLTVDNHLAPMYGVVDGAATQFPVARGMSEGERDIIFEFELPSQDETYNNAKLASTDVDSVNLDISSSYSIVLEDGVYESNDLAPRKQGLMSEKVRIRFETLSIA